MKKQLLTITACALASIAMAQAPAFPGAEGVARWTTTGGRGGKVIHVTNLNDSGTGSLRAAVEASGARIVVFDVSGAINLTRQLAINRSNLTILGQTAPGDGICIKGNNVRINTDNVIIRFIRCRMGDVKQVDDDAMNGYFKTGGEKSNVIVDHCTMSWSTDECGSFYGINNFSLQWCVLSESLRNALPDKGSHGFGGIWGGKNAAYHHNLLAHHSSRNPRLDHDYVSKLKGPLDLVNNVFYNYGYYATYGGESCNETGEYKMYNMINNYYKPGPASNPKDRIIRPTTKCKNCTGESTGLVNIVPGHFYLSGNYVEGYSDITSDNWKGVHPDDDTEAMKASIKSNTRFIPEGYEGKTLVTTHTAEKAFDKVLSYAGASYKKDVIDQRIARETKEGTFTYYSTNGSSCGIIDTQNDVGGWPEYKSSSPMTDTDKDGMPDVWETANGLNPNDASDASTYTLDSKEWYTNIEVYANSLVENLVKAQNTEASTAIDEYYPICKKAEGISYYDPDVTAEGGYDEASLPKYQFYVYPTKAMSIQAGNETQITSDAITGGKIYAINKQDAAKDMVKSQSNETGFQFTNNNTYFKVVLDEALQAGDIISARLLSRTDTEVGLFLASTETYPSEPSEKILVDQAETAGWVKAPTYTVTADDGICGKNTFYIFRATAKGTFFNTFFITRTGSTSISTPVTLKLKGDGTFYNLKGQKVDSSYKGLVIQDGKKYIQK